MQVMLGQQGEAVAEEKQAAGRRTKTWDRGNDKIPKQCCVKIKKNCIGLKFKKVICILPLSFIHEYIQKALCNIYLAINNNNNRHKNK